MNRRALLLVAAVAVSGCDAYTSFRGSARSAPTPAADGKGYVAGKPLARARVTLRMPNSPKPLVEAFTAEDGSFRSMLGGGTPKAATIRVEHEGYAPLEVNVLDICAVHEEALERCLGFVVNAELHPLTKEAALEGAR